MASTAQAVVSHEIMSRRGGCGSGKLGDSITPHTDLVLAAVGCVCGPQMHSDKHGWGSHYTGYGDDVHVNEAGGLGITSAHASEDSIELMVSLSAIRQ